MFRNLWITADNAFGAKQASFPKQFSLSPFYFSDFFSFFKCYDNRKNNDIIHRLSSTMRSFESRIFIIKKKCHKVLSPINLSVRKSSFRDESVSNRYVVSLISNQYRRLSLSLQITCGLIFDCYLIRGFSF